MSEETKSRYFYIVIEHHNEVGVTRTRSSAIPADDIADLLLKYQGTDQLVKFFHEITWEEYHKIYDKVN